MAERQDPLSNEEGRHELLERPFYATGMLLTAEDFDAEQTYHRGRLARALTELHGYGTAAGLEVHYRQDEPRKAEDALIEQIIVEPGLAVDRLGRVIEVPGPACLRLDRWWNDMAASADPVEASQLLGAFKALPVHGVAEAAASPFAGDLDAGALRDKPEDPVDEGVVVLDVFLRYVACESGKTPAFASGSFDATDAVQPSRLRDSYEIFLVPRGENDLRETRPVNPWATVLKEAKANRPAALRRRVLAARPFPASEYATAQDDLSAVLLARLAIQSHLEADKSAPQRPDPIPAHAVYVNNLIRPFLFSPIAVAILTGF